MSPGQITELYQWVRCHQTERPRLRQSAIRFWILF